jgi:hypothetical protein
MSTDLLQRMDPSGMARADSCHFQGRDAIRFPRDQDFLAMVPSAMGRDRGEIQPRTDGRRGGPYARVHFGRHVTSRRSPPAGSAILDLMIAVPTSMTRIAVGFAAAGCLWP